jgi:hypothetical protein
MVKAAASVALFLLLSTTDSNAQVPSGTIAGVVTDATGAALPGARVRVVHRDGRHVRMLTTSPDGAYAAAVLLPGVYEVTAAAVGFHELGRQASVEAGTTTRVDFTLGVRGLQATVRVEMATPLISRDHHQVGGVVTREQIDLLPLNGRNILDLAKLEPGVTNAVRGTNNRVFVPTLGGGLQTIPRIGYTRVAVDGANIGLSGAIGTGLQVSQDTVQEFQISTVNLDVANSLTTVGAVNVVTRAGGNQYEGSGFFSYRDQNLTAYPGLLRDPRNDDPFFRRQLLGASIGGPIRKDRAFLFASYERHDQRGVVTVQPTAPEFAALGGIFTTSYVGHLFSGRLDLQLSSKHRLFGRHSQDRNRAFAPVGPASLPSGWSELLNRADQSIIALTSVVSAHVVNDVRVSSSSVDLGDGPARSAQCQDCFGVGMPRIVIPDAGVTLGIARTSSVRARRYQMTESVTWQRNRHRLRFSFDWEHSTGTESFIDSDPVEMTLWSPRQVRELAPTLPAPNSFPAAADVLRLPLRTFQTGVGPGFVPQRHFRPQRTLDLLRLYVADTWQAADRLALNGGLAWSYEPNALNHDLSKPPLLRPLLGPENLNPPRVPRASLAPALGFVWAATGDGRTVVRAGAGRYFDPVASANSVNLSNERRALLPIGTGRVVRSGSNILEGGGPLDFQRQPTAFSGADLLGILDDIRADLLASLTPANRDFSVRAIDVTKEGRNLSDPEYGVPSAVHLNLGVQRGLPHGFVVTADAVWRRFTHTFINGIDYNRWNSLDGPVIPACSTEQRNDVGAVCSNGSIFFDTTMGRARYMGLLVRLEKRYSRGYQVLLSYALGSYTGTNGTGTGTAEGTGGRVFGFNNDDWFENYGALPTDRRHTLNVSGFIDLPWQSEIGFNVSVYSRPPFSAYVSGTDFNGDGTINDLLPGTRVNEFGRRLDSGDLARLVQEYNRHYAGRRFGAGNVLARELILPREFSFDDNFLTLDLRLTRSFRIGARARLVLAADVFNLLNMANLVGYSGDLSNTATFGKPTGRFTHIFGSGGPRAFEFGTRVIF